MSDARARLYRLRIQLWLRLFKVFFRPERKQPLIRLGSSYGGWWVPTDLPESAICYLAGVGTDISFDRALLERFACRAWGLDPTPRAVAWVAQQELPSNYHFLPLGLAGSSGPVRFYAPADENHVSHSMVNLQRTDTFFEADCITVAGLMRQLGHPRVDLLKMDIEGAQHDVVDSLVRDGIMPEVLCLEFDQPEPLSLSRATVRRLRSNGYALVKLDGFNMTFMRA